LSTALACALRAVGVLQIDGYLTTTYIDDFRRRSSRD
jgi:hypothetical protein